MNQAFNLAGRILLAQLFIISGFSKIGGYAGTQAYMASVGLPGALLPLAIALEVLGGLALIAGFRTRWVALALAGFSVVSALAFHTHFGDPMQFINFMKNLAIAGGLLLLAQAGAQGFSIERTRAV